MTASPSDASTQQVLFIQDMNLLISKLNQNPQNQVLALSIVAHLLSQPELLDLYRSSKQNWVLALPAEVKDIQSAALLLSQIQSETASLFIYRGESQIKETKEKYKVSSPNSFGKIRVLFIEPGLVFARDILGSASQSSKPQKITTPPKNPADELNLPDSLKERLAFLPPTIEDFKTYRAQKKKLLDMKTPYRTLMDPVSKPYTNDISEALGVRTFQVPPNQKPLPLSFDHRPLNEEEVIACEGIFYEKMMDELQGFLFKNLMIPGLKPSIVRDKNLHAWAVIGDSMTHYFRQAVGYTYKDTNYIFMKFRKYVHAPYKPSTPPPSASTKKANNSPSNSSSKGASPSEPWPDNSKEYQVLDGGSNYFQFHCDMKAREVFFAYVHGEA